MIDVLCDGCGMIIPDYTECQGGRGFVSHLSAAAATTNLTQADAEKVLVRLRGRGPDRVVCIHCFCDDYEKAYPGLDCYLREKADLIRDHPDLAKSLGLVK